MADLPPCACSSHLDHLAMCDEDCACYVGVNRVKVAASGRWADVTYRVLLDRAAAASVKEPT